MDAHIVDYTKAIVFVAAAIAMGIGTVGPALGIGMIGRSACENIGKYSESSSKIRMTMIIAVSMVEACAIYVFLTGLLIINKVS
ncbi:MAG TPA: ATP synthase F0 subunit C [Candidatus Saccharimonadales bacterium]|nr:ATP synthase F0 subunit C [Candidatus Saccharimonadales bacterium]